MTTQNTKQETHLKTLIPLYIFGSIFALLTLVGAYDNIMTITHNSAYFEYLGYGDRQIAYFTNYPTSLMLLFTLGVWGTVIGSFLLLFRLRFAIQAFGIAFFSQLVLNIYTFAFRDRWEVIGAKLGVQDTIILLLTLGMFLYSRILNKKGIIR